MAVRDGAHAPGGVLATAGGLVFTGDGFGYLIALDARTGKALWRFQTGARSIGAAGELLARRQAVHRGGGGSGPS